MTRTATPREVRRPSNPDLDRIAADLDLIRTLGRLAPGRINSLLCAAEIVRALSFTVAAAKDGGNRLHSGGPED